MEAFPDQDGPSPWFYRVLLLLVLHAMNPGLFSIFQSEPVLYTFAPRDENTVPRFTIRCSVPYFVKESFHSDYQGSLRHLEMEIEMKYLRAVMELCDHERTQNRLKMERGADSQELPTIYCDMADAYRARFNS